MSIDFRNRMSEELEFIYENESGLNLLIDKNIIDSKHINLERVTFSSDFIMFQFYISFKGSEYMPETKFIDYDKYQEWKQELEAIK